MAAGFPFYVGEVAHLREIDDCVWFRDFRWMVWLMVVVVVAEGLLGFFLRNIMFPGGEALV